MSSWSDWRGCCPLIRQVHALARGLMSFVISVRGTRRNEACTLPTHQIISNRCNYCLPCFPLWPSLFHLRLPERSNGCFKDSPRSLGWGHYNWDTLRFLLKYVQSSYFYFTLLALVVPRGVSLKLVHIWAWVASVLYPLTKLHQKQNSQTLPPSNYTPSHK